MLLAVITLSVSALVLYVSPVLPVVVALVTKANADPRLKAGVLIALSVASALVTDAIANGTDVEVDRGFLARLVVTLVVAIGTHFGIGRPLGITGADGKVAQATPNLGIG